MMRCIAKPSASMRARMGVMYPESGLPQSQRVSAVLDDLVKVDALARLLTEAIEKCKTVDGRIDERDVGAFVIRHMIEDGGATRPPLALSASSASAVFTVPRELEAKVVDMMAAAAMGRLITRAIESTQEADGLTKMEHVAVFILRAIKHARIT